jgi:hypothetical protein
MAIMFVAAASSLALPVSGILPSGGTLTDSSGIVLSSAGQGAGTGNFDPFLTVQATGTESGFNSNIGNNDTVNGGTRTHDLLFSTLHIVQVGGMDYYQISLDINQSGGVGSTMDITGFSLYTHNMANLTQSQFNMLSPVISLSMAYNLTNINGGSGVGDVQFYIPISALAGAGTYVTLFGSFSGSNDGFEEFAANIGSNTPAVPDNGMTVALLGLSFGALALLRRSRAKHSAIA